MAVVTIHAPRTQYALHVAIVSRPPNMVHHFVAAVFDNSCANFGSECFQCLIPGCTLPLAFAALACTLQRIENALRVIDLVNGSRSLRTIATAAARMIGIALKFLDTPGL